MNLILKQINTGYKLLLLNIIFLVCSSLLTAQTAVSNFGEREKKEIITKALELIKENFVFPERYYQIEKVIKEKITDEGYDTVNTREEFLGKLNHDLQTAGRDRHLRISYSPQLVNQINEDRKNEGSSSPTFTPELLNWLQFENYGLRKVERLEGNIGYFKFDRFIDLVIAKKSITGAMNFIRNSSAIILDLTDNGGGSSVTSELIVNYFLPDGQKIGDVKFRNNPLTKESVVIHDSSVSKIPEGVPVYILVSNKTASAAEAVSYVLQQFKRAKVIGEQTSGKANPGELFVVNDSLYMMVPTGSFAVLPTGTNWEGTGVTPDFVIDPILALPKAITEVCSLLEKSDENGEHKILYSWIKDQYLAQLNPEFPSQKFIDRITGNYENGRRIVYENGIVYYVGNTGVKRKLTYLNNHTFMIEGRNDYRLQFPSDREPVEYYTVLWYDGTSEKVGKIN
ncbi:MAG: S41 family peptidase [Bacteroidota bacterium]